MITESGESVAGKINVPNCWKVETDLGTLTPDAQQLKTITFIGRVGGRGRRQAGPGPPRRRRPIPASRRSPPAAEPAKDSPGPARPGSRS